VSRAARIVLMGCPFWATVTNLSVNVVVRLHHADMCSLIDWTPGVDDKGVFPRVLFPRQDTPACGEFAASQCTSACWIREIDLYSSEWTWVIMAIHALGYPSIGCHQCILYPVSYSI
jgi:hypothetical protein